MKVALIMGSDSDWNIMKDAYEVLVEFGIEVDKKVVSAHRTPHEMIDFASNASNQGYSLVIAGAGGAAHLPGMVASCTSLPVIGVPIALKNLDGMDSLLSIVQMPKGVPVATVGVNNAKNAGLLAVRILGLVSSDIRNKCDGFREKVKKESLAKRV